MAILVPDTTQVTSHGLLIQVAGAQPIGAVTEWSPSQSREVFTSFEFGSVTAGGGDDIPADSGEPFEKAPGNISGTTIEIARYDLYTSRFESAFGTNNLYMLTRQSSGIRFVEYMKAPDTAVDYTTIYFGVWFTRLGRRYSAEGDRRVRVDGSAEYTRQRPA